ncbi:pyridoxamine 5'-phosphate oxidase family protein [Facklamia sp. 7083-14-GEN3]|uniref:pyridoxamine 5'-phosphate oxidase family protein n=1 Tax=Facklamia sp. 7083-14-GEN3 TaxID=2973478 RepID=UPI00215C8CCB|nr:pyridoxamine 5'-phosphate oxidase family protein [Facklamia sp. 7083-14-GEN3]MCR8969625.1 pyridoxamine 5'-phosphate oxidase family protein [Facklamia sp. 7083-14-GEN3]
MSDIYQAMRRQDRAMPKDFAETVIDHSQYGVLSLPDQPYPYAIPLSIVRNNQTLYFHSAKAGKKVELIEDGMQVCVTFVGQVQVPNLYSESEIEAIADDPKSWGTLARTVFTTEFESAIVYGKIRKVTSEKELRTALRIIGKKYVPQHYALVDKAINTALDYVQIYAIEMDHLTGKRKKYDDQGQEMKHARGWKA